MRRPVRGSDACADESKATYLLVVVQRLALGLEAARLLGVPAVDLTLLLLERTDPVPQAADKRDLALELVLEPPALGLSLGLLSAVPRDEVIEVGVGRLEGIAGGLEVGDEDGRLWAVAARTSPRESAQQADGQPSGSQAAKREPEIRTHLVFLVPLCS